MTPTTGKAPAGEAEAFQNELDTYAGAVSTPHYTHLDGKSKASELLAALGLGRAGLIEVKCIKPPDVRMFWYTSADELLADWRRLDELNRTGWHVYFGVASFKAESLSLIHISEPTRPY